MNITDQQIIAHLCEIQEANKADCREIIATTSGCNFIAVPHHGFGTSKSGETAEAALANMRATIENADVRAEKKREAARKLMAEADAISPPRFADAYEAPSETKERVS